MYADRSNGQRFNPGSLGVAIGINAALVAALLYAGPNIGITPPRPPIKLIPIDPIVPPPPVPPKPLEPTSERPTPTPLERVEAVLPPIPIPNTGSFEVLPGPSKGIDGGVVGGTGTATVVEPPRAAPVVVGPAIDPRYADDYQPTYPAAERRAGREGRVVARVLVDVDGRVKAIERVSAASDAFWRSTEDRALRRWRFTPGTRDGVAMEAWRTMTLTFRLED